MTHRLTNYLITIQNFSSTPVNLSFYSIHFFVFSAKILPNQSHYRLSLPPPYLLISQQLFPLNHCHHWHFLYAKLIPTPFNVCEIPYSLRVNLNTWSGFCIFVTYAVHGMRVIDNNNESNVWRNERVEFRSVGQRKYARNNDQQ